MYFLSLIKIFDCPVLLFVFSSFFLSLSTINYLIINIKCDEIDTQAIKKAFNSEIYFQIREEDDLPKIICETCQTKLESCREFFEQIYNATVKLLSILR